jgi:hypothetical protein
MRNIIVIVCVSVLAGCLPFPETTTTAPPQRLLVSARLMDRAARSEERQKAQQEARRAEQSRAYWKTRKAEFDRLVALGTEKREGYYHECARTSEMTVDECRQLRKQPCQHEVGDSVWTAFITCGDPDSDRTSDYGDGIQHQYCWDSFCVYDDNNDGVIDAYN